MGGFGGKRVCIRLGCALTGDLGYVIGKHECLDSSMERAAFSEPHESFRSQANHI